MITCQVGINFIPLVYWDNFLPFYSLKYIPCRPIFLFQLHGLGLWEYIAIPATIATYVRIEVFLYTLAQIVILFYAFPAISATTCYFLYIFWVLIDMYIIHLFPDACWDGSVWLKFFIDHLWVMWFSHCTPVLQVPVFFLTPQCCEAKALDVVTFKLCTAYFKDTQNPFEVNLGAQIMFVQFTQEPIDIMLQHQTFNYHHRQLGHHPSCSIPTLSRNNLHNHQWDTQVLLPLHINFQVQNSSLRSHNEKHTILFLMVRFLKFSHSWLLMLSSRMSRRWKWALSSLGNSTATPPYCCSWGLEAIWTWTSIQGCWFPLLPGRDVAGQHQSSSWTLSIITYETWEHWTFRQLQTYLWPDWCNWRR